MLLKILLRQEYRLNFRNFGNYIILQKFCSSIHFLKVSDYSFVSPQEYGIENDEKLDIGLLTSMPLVQQILTDVREIEEAERAMTKIYFTKGTIVFFFY
jgi:hypothetical protein